MPKKLGIPFLSLNFDVMIDVKDITGKVKLSIKANPGSVHKFELMKEDYVNLMFSVEEPILLEIGDYIEYAGSLYYLTDKTYPAFNTETEGYDYTVRFDSHYYRWKNHIIFYDRQGNREASWSLTRAPEAHLSVVVSNLREIGFTYNGTEYQAVVDSSVDAVAKLVTYDNTNIIDALTKIAETWECEWWVDKDKIYIGRLEHGESVDLEIGKELSSMSRSQSQDIFATRLYAFGSTRNIPSNYRKGQECVVVENVVQKRLMLPEGIPYIDVIEGLDDQQVVEAVVVFDDVYPRTAGSITEVIPFDKPVEDENNKDETKIVTFYRFKDANLTFSGKYILPGQDLHVIFQTGPLSGMDFALQFNPEGLPESDPEAQIFEIVRNETYGQWLPASPLIPGEGNKYILYNFDTKYVNDTLLPQAEQELLEKTKEYVKKIVSDPSTYTCSLNSYLASGYDENNGLLNPEKEIDLVPGQRVNLINRAYFENGRVSRVIGFEKKLDKPYDSPSYTIGESAAYSRFGELEQKIDSLQFGDNTYVNQGGGSFGVYIIKKDDPTAASDENVFSSLRTLYEINKAYVDISDMYLRKDINDVAHGNITFDQSIGSTLYLDGWDGKGWRIENTGVAEFEAARIRSDIYIGNKIGSPDFTSGFTGTGWQFDTPTASGTVDNLTVRKSFKVYEMVYSQVHGLNSSFMVSDWNKIKSVTPLGTNRYRCELDDMDKEMFVNLRVGDYVRTQRRDGLNIRYFVSYVENISNDSFDVKVVDGEDAPVAGDYVQRQGNDRDKNRQGLIYFTSSDDYAPYIDILDDVTGPKFEMDSIKVRLGNCEGITVNGKPLKGHRAYINGGVFVHSTYYTDDGNTIEQRFEIMDGKLDSSIEEIRKDLSEESGNILRNSSFSSDLNYWEINPVVHFINASDGFLWLPSEFYVDKEQVADIYRDGNRNVLRIRNSVISQPNGIMNVPEHESEEDLKTYSFSLYYKVLRPGTYEFGIPGTDLYASGQMDTGDTYQKLSKVGKWNGKGDFKVRFSGEILIYGLNMFSDAMADAIIKLETQIEQTSEHIKLLATKEYVDGETGKIYIKYDGELKVTAEQISAINTKTDNINNTIESSGWINTAQGQQLFAKKEMEDGDTIVSSINISPGTIKISADKIDLVGRVTFSMFNSSLQNTINNKVDPSDLGDLAYADYITKGMMSTALQSELNGKVSESALGSLAYASSISKNNLAQSLLTEFNGKANSSSLKALAYLDKVEEAQLGATIISGGHIVTSLIDTDTIYANQAYVGGFSIVSGNLIGSGGRYKTTLSKNGVYIEDIIFDRNIRIGMNSNALTKEAMLEITAAFADVGNWGAKIGGGVWLTNSKLLIDSTSNKGAIEINIGSSANGDNNTEWLVCGHSTGYGSEFVVGSRYFGDSSSMDRTVIKVGKIMTSEHVKRLTSSPNFIPVYYDDSTGYLCAYL